MNRCAVGLLVSCLTIFTAGAAMSTERNSVESAAEEGQLHQLLSEKSQIQLTPSRSIDRIAQLSTAPKQAPVQPAPSESDKTNRALLEQLQRLEQKQQQLEQEINALRQQLNAPKNAVTVAAPENRPQEFEISAQALFLRPKTSNLMDFAIIDPGTALATSGEVAKVNYNDVTALRVGLTYRPKNTAWTIAATHTFFDTDGQRSAARAANGFLFSTFTHPFQNDSADTADAQAELNYRATDLELAYNLEVGKGLGLRLFGGVRFSDVNQEMTVAFNGRDFNNSRTRTTSDFSGFGPRVGAQTKLRLADDLNLFAQGAGSLLFGKRSTTYLETDNAGADVVAQFDPGSRQNAVPGLEFAVGLSWQPKIGKNSALNFMIGYEYQHLFNVSNAIRFVDSSAPGVFSESQNDLTLRGLFLRVGISSEF